MTTTEATPPTGGRTVDITTADRLRIARIEAALGQAELAQRIGCAKGTVTNYEDRKNAAKRKDIVLRQWALATGFSFDWLKYGVDTTPTQGDAQSRWMTRGTSRHGTRHLTAA
jgi:transcriptional regulator with XRE-family HTH domain